MQIALKRWSTRIHLWLGYAIGAQVMIWLISGLFMVWFDIDTVRGSHLRAAPQADTLDWPADAVRIDALAGLAGHRVETATARLLLDQPVWQISGDGQTSLVDARTGAVLSPITSDRALNIAQAHYRGDGEPGVHRWHDTAPRDSGLSGPAWQISFGPEDRADLYIDPQTGTLRSVRTDLWRAFDFFWGLHIMDWSTRENFNSWWIKMTTALSVLFGLAGVVLIIIRLWPARRPDARS